MQSAKFEKPSKYRVVDVLVGTSNPYSLSVIEAVRQELHDVKVEVIEDHSQCKGGDLLIGLSYGRRIPESVIARYGLATVVHASALPEGRGWSPANWMLENLETSFTISLIQLAKEIDEGPIIAQRRFEMGIGDLWGEFIQESKRIQKTLLIELLRGELDVLNPRQQEGSASYYRKRTPADSEIDPSQSLEKQWGKIRAADPSRYPNFFRIHGKEFVIEVKQRGTEN
jgi:methionyl-tRNA formyltransferase